MWPSSWSGYSRRRQWLLSHRLQRCRLRSSSSGSTRSTAAATPAAPGNNRNSTSVRSDEKAVSTADAATLKAAALKAVPGGSVYRIESDAGDGTYEAHMTKADGTLVTVKFDKNLAVTAVEDG